MDFVSFSLNYWEDLWQSRHQVMLALSQKHKVLFVSPPFLLNRLVNSGGEGPLPKSGIMHRGANLHTLVFPKYLFETYRFPRLQKLINYLRQRQVHRATREFGFQDIVLFIWHPQFSGLIGTLEETVCCYYVDDEFSAYAGDSQLQHKAVLEQEDVLLRRCDLVFANGSVLSKAKNRYGNAINVPMAADFELYSRSRLPETQVPPDLEAIPHPRIGYIGNLNDKVDFVLLHRLGMERPNWSLVLVGPVNIREADAKANFEAMKQLPNVFLLGFKPRGTLPGYIKGLDVCTMCYRKQGWANSVYPLKLHEYLASGKPCIGSGLASLREFSEVVQIAETPQEWLEAIQRGIEDKDQDRAERRIQVAYENRLETRIATIEKAIEQKIQEKRRRAVAG